MNSLKMGEGKRSLLGGNGGERRRKEGRKNVW